MSLEEGGVGGVVIVSSDVGVCVCVGAGESRVLVSVSVGEAEAVGVEREGAVEGSVREEVEVSMMTGVEVGMSVSVHEEVVGDGEVGVAGLVAELDDG